MLCPETLYFWIMNLQYVPNSCLPVRCFFLSFFFFPQGFWSRFSSLYFFHLHHCNWTNLPGCCQDNRKRIITFQSNNEELWLGKTERQSFDPSSIPPVLFIFNSEVVYFFMIATSVCFQCQLPLSATLCSIIPVQTPKSPWHHSTGCCSNFTGVDTKGQVPTCHQIT